MFSFPDSRRLRRFLIAGVALSVAWLVIYSSLISSRPFLQILGWRYGPRPVERLFTSEIHLADPLLQSQMCLDGSRISASQVPVINDRQSSSDLDLVAQSVKSKYTRFLEVTLSNHKNSSVICQPVVVEYRCIGSQRFRCGGLGDRFRGVSSVFFTALITNSIFSINWEYPTEIEHFFEPQFLSKNLIYDHLLPRYPAEYHFDFTDNEIEAFKFFNDTTGIRNLFGWYDLIGLEINTLSAVEALFARPEYRPMVEYYGLSNLTPPQLLSVALRILWDRPTDFLSQPLLKFRQNLSSNKFDGTFGVQIREGPQNWRDPARVPPSLIKCFARETFRIAQLRGYRNICLFLTADSDSAMIRFKDEVSKLQLTIPKLAVTIETADEVAPISHIDRSKFDDSSTTAHTLLRTFVDWAVLGSPEIDHLIISRSSFPETAALMQLNRLGSDEERVRRLIVHENSDVCDFDDSEMKSFRMEASSSSYLSQSYIILAIAHTFLFATFFN